MWRGVMLDAVDFCSRLCSSSVVHAGFARLLPTLLSLFFLETMLVEETFCFAPHVALLLQPAENSLSKRTGTEASCMFVM
eukprot:1878021-Rhodomonas_salina.2